MPESRSYLHPEDRRRTLLDAAHRLFELGGFDSLTNIAVANEAGVSRALVYGFFPDNAALLVAYFESRVRGYQDKMDALSALELNAADRTVAAFRMMCQLPLGDLLALSTVMNAHGNDHLEAMSQRLREWLFERMKTLVEFDSGPIGVFPALWLLMDVSVSMATYVVRNEMTIDGAETLLLALTAGAKAELDRRRQAAPPR